MQPARAVPRHDPAKPTVAVILGDDLTEITDVLGPYEMFSRAGAFNVYAVASERRPILLSSTFRRRMILRPLLAEICISNLTP